MALVILAAVAVVSAALLLIERQNFEQLQEHVSSLREENRALKSRLDDFRTGLVKQEAAVRIAD